MTRQNSEISRTPCAFESGLHPQSRLGAEGYRKKIKGKE
jgi:hypothetical protein